MVGRPEGQDGWSAAVSWSAPNEDWEPWRPGDPSAAGDVANATPRGRESHEYRWPGNAQVAPESGRAEAASSEDEPRGRWWTEDVRRRHEVGDRVRSREPLSGAVFRHVEPGARGEVIATRQSLLGDDFATVRFENGYTEEVKGKQIERRGWLD